VKQSIKPRRMLSGDANKKIENESSLSLVLTNSLREDSSKPYDQALRSVISACASDENYVDRMCSE
jgi:hypothetical protein